MSLISLEMLVSLPIAAVNLIPGERPTYAPSSFFTDAKWGIRVIFKASSSGRENLVSIACTSPSCEAVNYLTYLSKDLFTSSIRLRLRFLPRAGIGRTILDGNSC